MSNLQLRTHLSLPERIHDNIVSEFTSTLISFTPAVSFTLSSNNSQRVLNIVNISISGTVTGDVGGLIVPIGTISNSFPNNIIVMTITCVAPFGILVGRLNTNGTIETCPSGFPFPIGSYSISINITYML